MIPMNPVAIHDRARIIALAVICPLLYVGLPILIFLDVIPWDMKFVVLVVGAIATYVVMRILRFSNRDLGISTVRWADSLRSIVPLTAALVVASLVVIAVQGSRFDPTESWAFYIFYVFISCPAQEFLYRGVLGAISAEYSINKTLEYSFAGILFGFMHFIYRDAFTVAIMIVMGLVWYFLYKKSTNLLGVSVSHAVLGVLTIALGLVD